MAGMENRIFIGIDPGDSGAMAVIDSCGNVVETIKFTNFRAMCKKLKFFAKQGNVTIGIEKVHGFPGMNTKAMTTFMINFGGWLSIIECLDLSGVHIPPRTWMKEVLGSFPKGKSKPTALKYAKRKWPKLRLEKEDHGVIDALCVTQYLIQTNR